MDTDLLNQVVFPEVPVSRMFSLYLNAKFYLLNQRKFNYIKI